MDILKKILGYAIKYKKRVFLAISFLISYLILNLITPYLSRILIDDIITDGKKELLIYILSTILIMAILRGIFIYFRAVLFEKISQRCIYDIRNDLYCHLQSLSFSYYDNHRIGELMSRMTGDLEGIRVLLVNGITIFLENIINFTGTAIILFSMNAKLALATLCVAPLLAWEAYRLDKEIRPAFNDIRKQNAILNTTAQENISGVRVVKAFAREHYETDKFAKQNLLFKEKNIKAGFIWGKSFPKVEFISGLSAIALLWFGGNMVAAGEISLGTVVAFNGYLWMLVGPMRMIGPMVNMLAQAISSGERVFNILATGSRVKEKLNPYSSEDFKGHITFKEVSFYYKEEQVLSHINMDIPAGKTIAIMGATGAGKTSIINLIGRFYDVTKGEILIDGVDIKEWKFDEFRNEMSFIMQDVFLFSDTIEGNILFGNPSASKEDVIKACKIAGAHDFIMEMPDEYETVIGERGMGLSGGQKQRISIARAIVKNAKILIMDDCTSAVDMEKEHEIQQHLKKIMKNRTTIIIAHRISSVKNADKIFVLDEGRIIESGKHDELVKSKGKYYNMYLHQYKEMADEHLNEKYVKTEVI